MGFRIRSHEPIDEGVRRICREQLDKVASELAASDNDPHEGIHQVRKRFKKVRAVLRLVRPSLGEVYRSENAWFRDQAAGLSQARDASALIETLGVLAETYSDQVDEAFLSRVREAFLQRREGLQVGDVQARVDGLVADLGDARDRVDGWILDAAGFDAVGPGFAKTYARGRVALAEATASPTEENVHELRKAVKYHRYHIQILVPLWPKVLESLLTASHDLTDVIGEHQDLHVMRQTLRAEPELLDPARDAQVLLGLLDRRQAELRQLAQPLARRIYAEKPKAALRRLGAYWEAWADDANPPRDPPAH
jgi:CHAD domain-containing protein